MIDKVLNPHKLDSVIGNASGHLTKENSKSYPIPPELYQKIKELALYQKEIKELSTFHIIKKNLNLFQKANLNHEYTVGIIEEEAEFYHSISGLINLYTIGNNSIYKNNDLSLECGDLLWYALQYLSHNNFPILEILKSEISMACLCDKSLYALLQKFDIHNTNQINIFEKFKDDVRNEHEEFIRIFSSSEKRKARKDEHNPVNCVFLIVKHILYLLQIMSLLGFDISEIIQLNREKITDRLHRNRIKGSGDHR